MAELLPAPVVHKHTSCKNIQQLSIYASMPVSKRQTGGERWQLDLEQMKGLLFQDWRKGRWKSWQCEWLWMKVVYTNSRGDKCL